MGVTHPVLPHLGQGLQLNGRLGTSPAASQMGHSLKCQAAGSAFGGGFFTAPSLPPPVGAGMFDDMVDADGISSRYRAFGASRKLPAARVCGPCAGASLK